MRTLLATLAVVCAATIGKGPDGGHTSLPRVVNSSSESPAPEPRNEYEGEPCDAPVVKPPATYVQFYADGRIEGKSFTMNDSRFKPHENVWYAVMLVPGTPSPTIPPPATPSGYVAPPQPPPPTISSKTPTYAVYRGLYHLTGRYATVGCFALVDQPTSHHVNIQGDVVPGTYSIANPIASGHVKYLIIHNLSSTSAVGTIELDNGDSGTITVTSSVRFPIAPSERVSTPLNPR